MPYGSRVARRATPPTLRTERLLLRPLTAGDAAAVSTGAGDDRVARYLLQAPSPYPVALAREWIAHRNEWWQRGHGVTLAIATHAAPAALVGTVSLRRTARDRRGELGYWLATPAWGQGYATEAVRAIVDYGFGELALARVFAHVIVGNDASVRILAKLGMMPEGVQRQHVRKGSVFHDLAGYGVLRAEWRVAK